MQQFFFLFEKLAITKVYNNKKCKSKDKLLDLFCIKISIRNNIFSSCKIKKKNHQISNFILSLKKKLYFWLNYLEEEKKKVKNHLWHNFVEIHGIKKSYCF